MYKTEQFFVKGRHIYIGLCLMQQSLAAKQFQITHKVNSTNYTLESSFNECVPNEMKTKGHKKQNTFPSLNKKKEKRKVRDKLEVNYVLWDHSF